MRYLLIIILYFCLQFNLLGQKTLFKNNTEYNDILSTQHLYSLKLLNNESLESDLIKLAKKGFIVLDSQFDPVKYKDNINWEINPYDENSWLLKFHSLNLIKYLCKGYLNNKKPIYLKKAFAIAQSWLQKFPVSKKLDRTKFRYVWSTHGTSERIKHLSILLELMKLEKYSESDIMFLYNAIDEHAKWLSTPKYYQSYNHGIIMDLALLETSLSYSFFSSCEKWKNLSLTRLKKRYSIDVSSEGFHLENSPAYHVVVLKFLQKLIDLFNFYKVEAPQEFYTIEKKMISILPVIAKPNGYLPRVGDTEGSEKILDNFKLIDGSYRFNFNNQKYVVPATNNSFHSTEAGIAILKSNHVDLSSQTYIYFNAGYPSKIHKHLDNLSFIVHSNGEDLLIDPGLYSYTKSPLQQYFRSTMAHNTVVLNDKSHSKFPINNSKLIHTQLTDTVDIAVGVSNAYPGTNIKRTLIFIKPNHIIIRDDIEITGNKTNVKRVFNLGLNCTNYKKDGNLHSFQFKKNNIIINSLDNTTSEIYRGSNESYRGTISNKLYETTAINQLVYDNSINKSMTLVTLIEIIRQDTQNMISDVRIIESPEFIIDYNKNGNKRTITLD